MHVTGQGAGLLDDWRMGAEDDGTYRSHAFHSSFFFLSITYAPISQSSIQVPLVSTNGFSLIDGSNHVTSCGKCIGTSLEMNSSASDIAHAHSINSGLCRFFQFLFNYHVYHDVNVQ